MLQWNRSFVPSGAVAVMVCIHGAAAQTYVRVHEDVVRRGAPAAPSRALQAGDDTTASSTICNTQARVLHGQPAPGIGGGTFSLGAFFNPANINSSNRIAFFSQVDGSLRNQGIFVADAGGVSAIAVGCGGGGGSGVPGSGCGDPSPLGGTFSGMFGGTVFAPDINDQNDVLFVSDVNGGSSSRGLFLYRAAMNQIVKIAAVGDPSPIGGTFGAVGPGSMNNNGRVVFLASPVGTTNSNIFMWNNGVVTNVAKVGDPAPGGGTFSLLGTEAFGFADGTNIPTGPVPDINDAGQITFRAIVSGGITERGLIVSSAGVHQFYIKSGDATPAGGAYFDFQAACINASGQIAFFADYQPTPGNFSSGWFAGDPGNWRKVLAFFDALDGGQCFGLAFSRNPMQALDDQGNVAVWTDVQLTGGTNMQERLLVSTPSGAFLTAARQGDPTPIGGTYGLMQAWPSKDGCRGTLSSSTPGAPSGAFSAHFVYTQCKTGDVNGNCIVNIDDLLAVINAWGVCPNCMLIVCPADVDGNCVVNIDDLLLVINNWG